MKRLGAAAVLVVIAVAIGLDVSDGSGSSVATGVAYVTGTATSTPQIWLADAAGTGGRRLGPGLHPLLSPDGATVAASSVVQHGPAIVLYSAQGSSRGSFFNATEVAAVAQAWSPDSRYLAVVLSSRDPVSDAASGLVVIDTKTLSDRVLAHGPVYGASFAPDGSDRIAYGSASSPVLSARVDIRVVGLDGAGGQQITHDGRSLNPVWGPGVIAFDHERLRSGGAPVYQVWLMGPDGTHRAQLTGLRVPPLLDGLVPISFSGDRAWLLAQYVGQDTSQAWAITIATHRAHALEIGGQSVTAAAMSRSGALALVEVGGFLNPPDQGVVEKLPLLGGRPTPLVAHGSEPSWNL
jgi:hypothetical protein